jgi:hypothetical protein
MSDFINTITKIYVRTTLDTHQTQFVESMYHHFTLNCPIQFIPSIATFPHDKKRQTLKNINIRPYVDYRKMDERVAEYDEFEYAADQWNIWTTIANDKREASKYKDTKNDVYMVLDTDTNYRRSLSNASLIFSQLIGKLRSIQKSKDNLSIMNEWDMILLSHFNSKQYSRFDGTHHDDHNPDGYTKASNENVVFINSNIGIPNQYVRSDGNYLLSSRGIEKLIASHYNTCCIPFNEFIYQLHNGIYPTSYSNYMTFSVKERNCNEVCNDTTMVTSPRKPKIFYLFHCISSVFFRKFVKQSSCVPTVYRQVKPFQYSRMNTTWSFIILLSPQLSNEDVTFVSQYGYTFGIPVVTIDHRTNPIIDGLILNKLQKRKYVQSIFITLYEIYQRLSDSKQLIFLYCGSRFAIPNCNPSKLIERFLTSNKSAIFCNYPDPSYDFNKLIVDGIWIAKLADVIVSDKEPGLYDNLKKFLYNDCSDKIFFDISTVKNEIHLYLDDTTRQIVFTDASDTKVFDYPFLYSSYESPDLWVIFNKLINYIDVRYPMIRAIDYSPNSIARPPLNGIQMFEHGHVVIYIPVTERYINMYKRYGFIKWVESIHEAFTLPVEFIMEIRYLYIRSIQLEPTNDSIQQPYHWAYRRKHLKRTVIFYSRLETDHQQFQTEFDREIDNINQNKMFQGLTIEHVYTPSFISLLNESLTSSKLIHSDYVWFVSPSHVLLPNLVGRIAETMCSVIAPCISRYKNKSISTSCFNDYHNDQPTQRHDLLNYVKRKYIGIHHMVHIQDTWCIHSFLFDKLRKGIESEQRSPSEKWESYLTRVLRKYYIPIYTCNRYEYGTNMEI